MARRDRQNLRLVAAALRLGRFGDFVVRDELRPALVGRDLRERGGQSGLAVVDVPDGADVHVRFAAIEFFFGHVVTILVVVDSTVAACWSCLRSLPLRDSSQSLTRAKAGADDQD